jgi:hypothetical protein
MQLSAGGVSDWEILTSANEWKIVEEVHSAWVDEKTGTLHFLDEERHTITALARGAWKEAHPQ